jgi:hypothetical protein
MRNALIIAAGTALALVSTPSLAKNDNHGNRHGERHWTAAKCPPGLAKKNNRCMPPGQYKKYYTSGQRIPRDWRNVEYRALPDAYRSRYGYNDDYRYYYNDGRVYAVDPTTSLIQSVINILR